MVGFEDPGGLSCGCSLDLGKESWKRSQRSLLEAGFGLKTNQ